MAGNKASALGGYLSPIGGEEQSREGTAPAKPEPTPGSRAGSSGKDIPPSPEELAGKNDPKYWRDSLLEVENQYMMPDWPQIERRMRAAGADDLTIEMVEDWYSLRGRKP